MMHYTIWNPTGNITALVDGIPAEAERKRIAGEILHTHPNVEQVGFLSGLDAHSTAPTPAMSPRVILSEAKDLPLGNAAHTYPTHPTLTMTGGEFCGNASMCAAAWYAWHTERSHGVPLTEITLSVSGADTPVSVTLKKTSGDPPAYEASLCMPSVLSIKEERFRHAEISAVLPVVRLPGIIHILISAGHPFSVLLEDPAEAERAVKTWCRHLNAEGLGLMFLSDSAGSPSENDTAPRRGGGADAISADVPGGNPETEPQVTRTCRMTPLVYIPGGDTLYWEHSCASGSAAAGAYFALRSGSFVTTHLAQPGGTLTVSASPSAGKTILHGTAALVSTPSPHHLDKRYKEI